MQELKKNQHLQEYIRLLENRLHQTDLHQWTTGKQVSLQNQQFTEFYVFIFFILCNYFFSTGRLQISLAPRTHSNYSGPLNHPLKYGLLCHQAQGQASDWLLWEWRSSLTPLERFGILKNSWRRCDVK